ncbi:MAG: hypothetical protein V2I48_08140 [Xanthomonadales bacterium]|jgi:hypothetical protein|nr:hypothetical protein [Xanthomonadales bacterium]
MGITRILARTWLTLIFLSLTAGFLVSSASLSPVASSVPRAISLATLVLLLMNLARELRSREDPTDDSPASGKGKLVVILWISTLPLAVMAAGITAGSALFSLVFLKGYARETWMTSLVFSLVLGACLLLLSFLASGNPAANL